MLCLNCPQAPKHAFPPGSTLCPFVGCHVLHRGAALIHGDFMQSPSALSKTGLTAPTPQAVRIQCANLRKPLRTASGTKEVLQTVVEAVVIFTVWPAQCLLLYQHYPWGSRRASCLFHPCPPPRDGAANQAETESGACPGPRTGGTGRKLLEQRPNLNTRRYLVNGFILNTCFRPVSCGHAVNKTGQDVAFGLPGPWVWSQPHDLGCVLPFFVSPQRQSSFLPVPPGRGL